MRELPLEATIRAQLQRTGHEPDSPVREDALFWKQGQTWLDAQLQVSAWFDDWGIVEGVRAIAALGARHGASHQVRLYEAMDRDDPLARLRAGAGVDAAK